MAPKPLNLCGQKFGRLTVLRFDKRDEKRNAFWFCICECGAKKLVRQSHLRSGKTQSCGCFRVEFHKTRDRTYQQKPGAAFRRLLSRYKKHARNRNLSWEITDEQFRQITSASCFYTGLNPGCVMKADSGECYPYNGIDRLENSAGYTMQNCVPCAHKINMMKKNLPSDEFISLCRLVAEHFRS